MPAEIVVSPVSRRQRSTAAAVPFVVLNWSSVNALASVVKPL